MPVSTPLYSFPVLYFTTHYNQTVLCDKNLVKPSTFRNWWQVCFEAKLCLHIKCPCSEVKYAAKLKVIVFLYCESIVLASRVADMQVLQKLIQDNS